MKNFKRGQVEWTLWQIISHLNGKDVPPTMFHTRIKRLLELDRTKPNKGTSYAFSECPPPGKGADAGFTEFDCFCLALGLDLLDSGFKQSEVVFALRHIRPKLESQYLWIMECPPAPRQLTSADSVPDDRPTLIKNKIKIADLRVFLVTQRIEISEAFSKPASEETPLILEPKYCRGLDTLKMELDRMGFNYRTAIILELANTAALVNQHLKDAPEIKRGRH